MTTRLASSDRSREEFIQRLRVARALLLETVTTTDEELAGLDRPRLGGHGLTAAVAESVLSRLSRRERQELDEIAAAQARLAAGRYGVCETCGRRIPLARLRAMPAARQCVACQRATEGRT